MNFNLLDPTKISTPIGLISLVLIISSIVITTYLRYTVKDKENQKLKILVYFCYIQFTFAGIIVYTSYFFGVKQTKRLESSLEKSIEALKKSNQAFFHSVSSLAEGNTKAFSLIQESVDLYPDYENLIIQATLLKNDKNPDYKGALEATRKASEFKTTKALLILQGELYKGLADSKAAMSSYFKAINLPEKVSNRNTLDGISYFNISGILFESYQEKQNQSTLDSSLTFANKAVNLLLHSDFELGSVYAKQAEMFLVIGDTVSASDYYQRGIKYYEHNLKNKIEAMYLDDGYINYSNLLIGTSKFNKALIIGEKAKEISIARNDYLRSGYAFNNVGDSYFGLKDKNKACENYKQAEIYFHMCKETALENILKKTISDKCK